MFGLEKITYLQFAIVMALIVCFYYLSVCLYLFVNSRGRKKPRSFELEEDSGQETPKIINAVDLLVEQSSHQPSAGNALKVSIGEVEQTGFPLEELSNPDVEKREAFIRELQSKAVK